MDDRHFFLKLSGHLKYRGSADFDQFLETFSDYLKNRDVLIDLTGAEYLDSTNLGLLARIADRMLTEQGKKTTIISTNEEITKLLINIGFDEFFIIINHPEEFQTDLQKIPELQDKERSMAAMMLDAHRALMKISEKNRETFRDVVTLLEKEVEGEKK